MLVLQLLWILVGHNPADESTGSRAHDRRQWIWSIEGRQAVHYRRTFGARFVSLDIKGKNAKCLGSIIDIGSNQFVLLDWMNGSLMTTMQITDLFMSELMTLVLNPDGLRMGYHVALIARPFLAVVTMRGRKSSDALIARTFSQPQVVIEL